MYSLLQFGYMISDEVRMGAYLRAMKKAIEPGSVVLDIGTGTGIMAFFALKFGAKFVYAIEPNDLIRIAEEVAKANGFSTQIKFIKDLSTNVKLDQKADVIVSDLRGALPLLGTHIPSIVDARTRLLKPGGTLIPARDTLWVSVVESRKLYKNMVEPWEKYGDQFDMDIARKMVVNDRVTGRAKAGEVLTRPFHWATLDYAAIQSPNVSGQAAQKILRPGTARGLIIWFDAEFIEGVRFYNKPGAKKHPRVYGSAFFPLQEPVRVAKGDQVELQLKATLVDDDYVWNWNTRITDGQGREKARFEQSTFYSQRPSLADLRKNNLAYIPKLNAEGEVDRFIVSLMDGSAAVEQIARKAMSRFPGKFKDVRDASARVSKLAKEYSE
jgi:protein arginine N-methyltransferase 1